MPEWTKWLLWDCRGCQRHRMALQSVSKVSCTLLGGRAYTAGLKLVEAGWVEPVLPFGVGRTSSD